mmetsp:Transcript_17507/g.70316  ORF Transcript_17507/g.70316 Transcript_17507/m.70316 type:complete len:231 (-) Transcript_17507:612-1304(-)
MHSVASATTWCPRGSLPRSVACTRHASRIVAGVPGTPGLGLVAASFAVCDCSSPARGVRTTKARYGDASVAGGFFASGSTTGSRRCEKLRRNLHTVISLKYVATSSSCIQNTPSSVTSDLSSSSTPPSAADAVVVFFCWPPPRIVASSRRPVGDDHEARSARLHRPFHSPRAHGLRSSRSRVAPSSATRSTAYSCAWRRPTVAYSVSATAVWPQHAEMIDPAACAARIRS